MRLARDKPCGIFVDRRAADPADSMFLLTEWSDEHDCILAQGRLAAAGVIPAACNLGIANMELIDFLEGGMYPAELDFGPDDIIEFIQQDGELKEVKRENPDHHL